VRRDLRPVDDRRMTTDATTGPSHPDAVTYRRTAMAFRAGDFDELSTTIHEHVIWHMPGTTWIAREVEGRTALVAYLQEITQRTNGTFTLHDVCVSGSDDHVAAAQRFGATVDGEERSFDVTSVMRFSGGLQKERWFNIHDQSAFDEFFARFQSQAHVPRGYAVQADLGAVTGGQASLYRRATSVGAEILRILDGLTPLRAEAGSDDLVASRTLVRRSVERLVEALGAAGGPSARLVDACFRDLIGQQPPTGPPSADTIGGQLGALRERFGLVDANVNTVEEEGIRTSFWTLVDLITDLQTGWTDRPARRPPP
jgi:ketosteroid isomerase-like protein